MELATPDKLPGILTADGDEAWIHCIDMDAWEPTAVRVSVANGVVSVEAVQNGVRVFADLLKLRKGWRSVPTDRGTGKRAVQRSTQRAQATHE